MSCNASLNNNIYINPRSQELMQKHTEDNFPLTISCKVRMSDC